MNSTLLFVQPLPSLAGPRLSKDTRGSILLPALAMVAVLMIGTMYIAEIAQDILARLALQTQADGAALEGAIWHAQGMNLLVTLNIVMAAIFALFLAIRLAILAVTTLLALVVIGSAIASLFSFGTAAAAGAQVAQMLGRGLQQLHQRERAVAKPTMNALKVISDAERVVAAAVPWVAAALPVSRLSGNPNAMVFSVSMLPNIFEQKFKDLGPKIDPKRAVVGGMNPRTQFPARMGSLPGGSPPRHRKPTLIGAMVGKAHKLVARGNKGAVGKHNNAGMKVLDALTGSLPAQDEDIFMVCSRSAEGMAALVTKVVFGWANFDQGSVESINSTFGKVVGSMPTLACMPAEQLDSKVLDAVNQQVQAACDEEKEKFESTTPTEGRGRHRERKWTQAQQIKCEKDQKDKSKKALAEGEKDPGGRVAAEDIKTAAIWGEILKPKESPLLHVWSINASEKWPYFPGDAEAEFRHLCNDAQDKDGRSCGDNSLWRYGWYAKNIPLRSLDSELVAHMGDFLQGWVNRAMGKAIQGVVGRLASFLPPGLNKPGGTGSHADPAARTVGDALNRQLAGLRHPEAGNGYWSRKLLGPDLGNLLGHGAYRLKEAVFR